METLALLAVAEFQCVHGGFVCAFVACARLVVTRDKASPKTTVQSEYCLSIVVMLTVCLVWVCITCVHFCMDAYEQGVERHVLSVSIQYACA